MAARRTAPLIALLVAGTALIVVRLAQVQVAQHDVWAEEARKLVRSGALLPYERGSLLDADGLLLVADTTRYQVELEYRAFRRGHPLGQVAHARGALEQVDIGLAEAREHLVPWANALVDTGPGRLAAFARGAALTVGDIDLPATREPSRDRRPSRAGDLRFYAEGLVGLDASERRALRAVETERGFDASYLEWAAAHRGRTLDEERARQERRWLAGVEDLGVLAERLETAAGRPAVGALERLVGELDDWRVAVDDAAAGRLFRDVAGFRAGRIAPETLLASFDLDWLCREMRWDKVRLVAFARQERASWLGSWRDGWAVPRLLAELRLDRAGALDADRALSALVSVHLGQAAVAEALDGRPRDWRAPGRLPVVDDLVGVLDLDTPRGHSPARLALPWQRDEFRERAAGLSHDLRWRLLAEATGSRAGDVAAELISELGEDGFERHFDGSVAGLWRVALGSGFRHRASNRARIQAAARALLDEQEDAFQALVAERAAELRGLGGARAADDGRLRFGPDRLDRLGERARHLVKDYGSRHAALAPRPPYEVVYLLTREPERYPGFVVRAVRDREAKLTPDDEFLPGAELLGLVAGVDAEMIQRQRQQVALFQELRGKANRSEEETRRLRGVMGEFLLADEQRGVSGFEGYADELLRGTNGYRERLGLEDVFGRGAHAIQLAPVTDGVDIRLTLVRSLQRAAERTINHPRPPPDDVPRDDAWLAAPVGAIVLLSAAGEVLAAASAPHAAVDVGPDAEGQRALRIERTLRQPGFQPIGSVFKPFVALHALEHHGAALLAPDFAHVCEPPPEGDPHAEWGGVRCHSRFGHGHVDLGRALEVSCNTYFAHVADLLAPDELDALARAVGFGLATGVEDLGPRRMRLETVPEILKYEPREDLRRQMRRGANGLQVFDGTPMQVARAFHALATGELADLALVHAVDATPLAHPPPARLPYRRAVVDAVRRDLVRVTHGAEGSARAALGPDQVGRAVAAKTGSADLAGRRSADDAPGIGEDPRQPKHTWIAGWLPADDPQIVFCVFVHDTVATASQSASWIARQLLLEPEVDAWLTERGVPRGPLATDEHGADDGAEGRGRATVPHAAPWSVR